MSDHNRTRHEILSGDQIFLAALQPDDFAQLARWAGNHRFAAHLGDLSSAAPSAARQEWFAQLASPAPGGRLPGNRAAFAVLERPAAFVGMVALYDVDQRRRAATLGIALSPERWGRGYGTEAVRLLVEYGFYQLQLASINLSFVDCNERGSRAYRRAGFREIDRRPAGQGLGGRRYDTVLMTIASDDVDLSRISAMLPRLIVPQA